MKVTDASEIKRFAPANPDAGRTTSAERPGTEDRVSTENSEQITATIAETSRAASGARAARLQAIASAVKAGTYRPDPQRIAQEILDEAELAARLQAIFGR